MLDYLQNSYENAALSNKEFSIFGKDIIFVKDSLPEHVDLKNVISKVERILPPWVVSEIDMIYIGHFETEPNTHGPFYCFLGYRYGIRIIHGL